jgi:putative protein kinase ArgK-like GTPase of G3E family
MQQIKNQEKTGKRLITGIQGMAGLGKNTFFQIILK